MQSSNTPYTIFKELVQCTSGHPLIWSKERLGYENDTYYCTLCHEQGDCTEGRWNCINCLYDLCGKCRHPKDSFYTDKSGHKLVWSNETTSTIGRNTHVLNAIRNISQVMEDGIVTNANSMYAPYVSLHLHLYLC